jgi:hypothetical protein
LPVAYARRLREAGFSEQQAEGQAQALAAAMTDSLATKQDLRELGMRLEYLEKHLDTRLAEFEKRLDTRLAEQEKRLEIRLAEQEMRTGVRFGEQSATFGGQLADLERKMTLRLGGIMIGGIGAASALGKLL